MSTRDLDDTDLPEYFAAKMQPGPWVHQRPLREQLDLFPETLQEPREGASAYSGYGSTGTISESATETLPVPFAGYLEIPESPI
jgi:hypothetical protein